MTHPIIAISASRDCDEWVRHLIAHNFHLKQQLKYEPVHEISNNVVCATSKASDQPAHTPSLIRPFASRLSIL